jgi:hypothetical protein
VCVHTPNGITVEHFCRALQKYNELKIQQQTTTVGQTNGNNDDDDNVSSNNNQYWVGYILNHANLGIDPLTAAAGSGIGGGIGGGGDTALLQGRVKFYSIQKKFGFVIDIASGREFFCT